jgi:endo-1,4-beta-xylanase
MGIASGDETKPKPATELPAVKELPNPFVFADGSPVRTEKDWNRRRLELKALFQDYEYGHLPPKAEKMTIKRGKVSIDHENGVALQDIEVKLEHKGKSLLLHVRLARPADAKGPMPVIIQGAFFFGRKAPASGRRFAAFTKRGYAVAELPFTEIAADNKNRFKGSGIHQLFGESIDCGALMAWAWGTSRVIDALSNCDEIDVRKVIATGHSRYGKAALVAGALDERITITVPSHSGCAGSAPFRFIYGKSEQLHNIAGAFPYWFRPNFNQFIDKVDRLPIDQHELLALVAPRALLQTEGTKDAWTNPEGAQLTHLAAKKVYDFLHAGEKIRIRFRPVGHIPSSDDLLDFADHVFLAKKLPEEFEKLPYKEESNGFHWSAPRER